VGIVVVAGVGGRNVIRIGVGGANVVGIGVFFLINPRSPHDLGASSHRATDSGEEGLGGNAVTAYAPT
jgi:hypothetical protein